jgi:hypothetical protein
MGLSSSEKKLTKFIWFLSKEKKRMEDINKESWEKLKKAFDYHSVIHGQKPTFYYKRCGKVFIEMSKKGQTLKTNEHRSGVFNWYFAKYRAEKMFVTGIYDAEENKFLSSYQNTQYGHRTIYRANEWVYPNDFNLDEDIICSYGIHYFQSLEGAFCYMNYPFFHLFSDNGSDTRNLTKDIKQFLHIPLDWMGRIKPTPVVIYL